MARKDALPWEEYHGCVAILAHYHSEDGCQHAGACLVSPDHQLLAIGWNNQRNPNQEAHSHATTDAILKAVAADKSLQGAHLYATRYPCPHCAQYVAQHGIASVNIIHVENDLVSRPKSCTDRSERGWKDMFKEKLESMADENFFDVAKVIFSRAKIAVNEQAFIMELKLNESTFDLKNFDNFAKSLALVSEKRSKDPATQVAAVVFDRTKKLIIGIGYNGMPTNCNDLHMDWEKHCKDPFVVHAERNAVTFSSLARYTVQNPNLEMFVTLDPCYFCRKSMLEVNFNLYEKCCYEREISEKSRQGANAVFSINIKPNQHSEVIEHNFLMMPNWKIPKIPERPRKRSLTESSQF